MIPDSPTTLLERRRPARLLALFLLATLTVSCAGIPDVEAWRARTRAARPADERGRVADDIARAEGTRAALDLEGSRRLALALVVENPDHARILHLASRAESDAVFYLDPGDDEGRALAALSALDYARRSVAASEGEVDAEVRAQLAWSLGTTTHLQPMFDRSEHAATTLGEVEKALAIDPDNVTALATLSTLRLRLATLPWIARLMAWGAPEGSVDEAVELATRCVKLRSSVEHHMLLARALIAAGRTAEASATLLETLGMADRHPRDRVLRPRARALLESLEAR